MKQKDIKLIEMHIKKIKISESKLYEIIKRVLIEQEEEEQEKEVWITDEDEFKSRLFDVFDGNSEKFTKVHNKHYGKILVNGDLDLDEYDIKMLPNNLHVEGSLHINENKNLKQLPKNLKVNQVLWAENTSIENIPDDIKIGHSLYLINAPIKTLPDNLIIKRKLSLIGCENLTSLPENLDVGKLIITNTQIDTLPESLKVDGLIKINNTPLAKNKDLIEKYEDKGYKIYRDAY